MALTLPEPGFRLTALIRHNATLMLRDSGVLAAIAVATCALAARRMSRGAARSRLL